MKKFLAVLLTICMVFALVVIPVSAEVTYLGSTFDYYLDLDMSNVISHTVNSGNAYPDGEYSKFEEYPLSNMFDGDPNTIAAISHKGHSQKWGGATKTLENVFLASDVIIDLGAEYKITGFAFSQLSSAQIEEVKTSYSGYKPEPTTTDGCYGKVFVSADDPTVNTSTAVSLTTTSKIRDTKAPTSGTYRYIKIVGGGWGNQGASFITSFNVKVAALDDGSIHYSKFSSNGSLYAHPDYRIENLFDGNPNTHALISTQFCSGGTTAFRSVHVIDLGVSRKLTKVKVTIPTSTARTEALNALGVTNSVYGNHCGIYLTNTDPSYTNITEASADKSSMTTVYSGFQKNATYPLDGSTPYRYLIIETTMDSAPAILSEIVLA